MRKTTGKRADGRVAPSQCPTFPQHLGGPLVRAGRLVPHPARRSNACYWAGSRPGAGRGRGRPPTGRPDTSWRVLCDSHKNDDLNPLFSLKFVRSTNWRVAPPFRCRGRQLAIPSKGKVTPGCPGLLVACWWRQISRSSDGIEPSSSSASMGLEARAASSKTWRHEPNQASRPTSRRPRWRMSWADHGWPTAPADHAEVTTPCSIRRGG